MPVDFSDYAEKAAQYAVEIAGVSGGEIILLNAYYDPMADSPVRFFYFDAPQSVSGAVLEKYEDDAAHAMQQFFEGVREHAGRKPGNLIVRYTVAFGTPEDAIKKIANEWQPDLIVMGTRGKGLRENVIWGSITADTIDAVNTPILAVPAKAVFRGFHNALYATGYDEADVRSIKKLLDILKPLDMKLYCVHVSLDGMTIEDDLEMDDLEEQFSGEFNEGRMHFEVMSSDDVIKSLDAYIDDKNIDIISFTTAKRNFFSKIINPSITKRMLFHTQRPMLIFHH